MKGKNQQTLILLVLAAVALYFFVINPAETKTGKDGNGGGNGSGSKNGNGGSKNGNGGSAAGNGGGLSGGAGDDDEKKDEEEPPPPPPDPTPNYIPNALEHMDVGQDLLFFRKKVEEGGTGYKYKVYRHADNKYRLWDASKFKCTLIPTGSPGCAYGKKGSDPRMHYELEKIPNEEAVYLKHRGQYCNVVANPQVIRCNIAEKGKAHKHLFKPA